jgi:hypothetical protein
MALPSSCSKAPISAMAPLAGAAVARSAALSGSRRPRWQPWLPVKPGVEPVPAEQRLLASEASEAPRAHLEAAASQGSWIRYLQVAVFHVSDLEGRGWRRW